MNNWKQMIKKAIEISNPKEASILGHSLLYKTYTNVTICSVCTKLLRGKFFQGYHCSGCNRDFHLECTSKVQCFAKLLTTKQDASTTIYGTVKGRDLTTTKTLPTISRLSSIFPQTFQNNLNLNGNGNNNINQHLQNINNTILSLNFTNGHGGGNNNSYIAENIASVGRIDGRRKLNYLNNLNNNNNIDNFEKKRFSRSSNCSLSEVITIDDNNNDSSSLHLSSPVQNNSTYSTKSPIIISSRIMETIDLPPERQNIPEEYPWYFGEIGRKIANNFLEGTEEGTFLVRWSDQNHQYVLSLCAEGIMKHIKIEYDSNTKRYCLHFDRYFDSVVELVNYYRLNSIKEGFVVDVILKGTPLKTGLFRAIKSFNRSDTSKYLTLIPGDIIQILETTGEQKGWWQGFTLNGRQFGYFPFSYVKPELSTQENHQIYYQNNNIFLYQSTSNNLSEQQHQQIPPPHLPFNDVDDDDGDEQNYNNYEEE